MPQTALTPPSLSDVDPSAWEPWSPAADDPWSLKWAGHLYRRAAFGQAAPGPSFQEAGSTRGPGVTIDPAPRRGGGARGVRTRLLDELAPGGGGFARPVPRGVENAGQ